MAASLASKPNQRHGPRSSSYNATMVHMIDCYASYQMRNPYKISNNKTNKSKQFKPNPTDANAKHTSSLMKHAMKIPFISAIFQSVSSNSSSSSKGRKLNIINNITTRKNNKYNNDDKSFYLPIDICKVISNYYCIPYELCKLYCGERSGMFSGYTWKETAISKKQLSCDKFHLHSKNCHQSLFFKVCDVDECVIKLKNSMDEMVKKSYNLNNINTMNISDDNDQLYCFRMYFQRELASQGIFLGIENVTKTESCDSFGMLLEYENVGIEMGDWSNEKVPNANYFGWSCVGQIDMLLDYKQNQLKFAMVNQGKSQKNRVQTEKSRVYCLPKTITEDGVWCVYGVTASYGETQIQMAQIDPTLFGMYPHLVNWRVDYLS